jgi:MoaA/NifB/PqqE/SkfB family radical SAM enzyme
MGSKTLVDAWDDPGKPWPSVVYVETTNHCNARCLCCLNHRCERTRGVMSLESFRRVVDRVKSRKVKIGAMFCFGEPLIDPTLEEKYALADREGVMLSHVGMNTNCSLLTSDRWPKILEHVHNITLSFFNVGDEYERLTGLSWEQSYRNALGFIHYRDQHHPGYTVCVGVNKVEGHDLAAVKRAFAGENVRYVQDAELRWGGSVVTGVLDRTVMYPDWRCDGMKGALQVKWDGGCEFCAYDIVGSPQGGETRFGNLLTDSWEQLGASFRAAWRSFCSLCAHCDYWHHGREVIDNHCRRPDPLPGDWYDWQLPFLKEGESPCD